MTSSWLRCSPWGWFHSKSLQREPNGESSISRSEIRVRTAPHGAPAWLCNGPNACRVNSNIQLPIHSKITRKRVVITIRCVGKFLSSSILLQCLNSCPPPSSSAYIRHILKSMFNKVVSKWGSWCRDYPPNSLETELVLGLRPYFTWRRLCSFSIEKDVTFLTLSHI